MRTVRSREGRLTFRVSRTAWLVWPETATLSGEGRRAEPIQVEVRRLDDLLPAETIAFIKVDVEGAELRCCEVREGF